jgi:hypothetical protein
MRPEESRSRGKRLRSPPCSTSSQLHRPDGLCWRPDRGRSRNRLVQAERPVWRGRDRRDRRLQRTSTIICPQPPFGGTRGSSATPPGAYGVRVVQGYLRLPSSRRRTHCGPSPTRPHSRPSTPFLGVLDEHPRSSLGVRGQGSDPPSPPPGTGRSAEQLIRIAGSRTDPRSESRHSPSRIPLRAATTRCGIVVAPNWVETSRHPVRGCSIQDLAYGLRRIILLARL